MTAIETVPAPVDIDEGVCHAYCPRCPDWALCGLPVKEWGRDAHNGDDLCVVCVELYDQPCLRCGAP